MKLDGKVLCIIALVAVIIFGGAGAWMYVNSTKEKEPTQAELKYESNIILSEEDVTETEKVDDDYIVVEMQNVAVSNDGKNFSGYICNARENTYELFLTIYDAESGEELYKSGLLPIDTRIETFQLNKKLEPGSYETVLVFHQVESDGVTEHATASFTLTLVVNE